MQKTFFFSRCCLFLKNRELINTLMQYLEIYSPNNLFHVAAFGIKLFFFLLFPCRSWLQFRNAGLLKLGFQKANLLVFYFFFFFSSWACRQLKLISEWHPEILVFLKIITYSICMHGNECNSTECMDFNPQQKQLQCNQLKCKTLNA